MVRFLTWKYSDGDSISQQWDPIMDGEWKYGDACIEVIFKLNTPSPFNSKWVQAEESN